MKSKLIEDDCAAGADLVLDLLEGFRRSKTLFAAVELGIFDGIRPQTPVIGRLLDACVALGLLKKCGDEYVNTPIAETYLRRDSPKTLSGYVRYSNATSYALWAHLEDAVTDGNDRWTQVFGDDAARQRARTFSGEDFCSGMNGLGLLSSPTIAGLYDLSPFTHMIDLGGCTGHLAAAVKARYPSMCVTVFDYPTVVERAREDAGPGIEFVAGDFGQDELPSADLIALGRILHSRSDSDAIALLRKLYERLPAGGGVLIVERFLDGATDRVDAHMNSLHMLVSTRGGSERTAAAYISMLKAAGFSASPPRVAPRVVDAILGRK